MEKIKKSVRKNESYPNSSPSPHAECIRVYPLTVGRVKGVVSARANSNKSQVVSITYEEIGLFPRSFSRVLDRFFQQLFSDVDNLIVQEYRFYRFLFLTTLKTLFVLIFLPFAMNLLAKNYIVKPVAEYFWNGQNTEIFLNSYQQTKAFAELNDFEEKLYFESLLKMKKATPASPTVSDPMLGTTTASIRLPSLVPWYPLGVKVPVAEHAGGRAYPHATLYPILPQLGREGSFTAGMPRGVESIIRTPSYFFPTVGRLPKAPDSFSPLYPKGNAMLQGGGAVGGVMLRMQQEEKTLCLGNAYPLEQPLPLPGRSPDTVAEGIRVRGTAKGTSCIQPIVALPWNNPTVGNKGLILFEPVLAQSAKTEKGEEKEEGMDTVEQKLQEKTLQLAVHYNNESIEAITNIFSDLLSFLTLLYLLMSLEIQINITKSFLLEVFFGLEDSKKCLLILLITDLLVGYHSPGSWEIFLESLFEHYGLIANQTVVLLLVATLPVLLDVLFKYLIFRHLNRSSPTTVATYQALIE